MLECAGFRVAFDGLVVVWRKEKGALDGFGACDDIRKGSADSLREEDLTEGQVEDDVFQEFEGR